MQGDLCCIVIHYSLLGGIIMYYLYTVLVPIQTTSLMTFTSVTSLPSVEITFYHEDRPGLSGSPLRQPYT